MKSLKNPQIAYALLWAAAILVAAYLTGDSTLPMVFTTLSGFHLVYLGRRPCYKS